VNPYALVLENHLDPLGALERTRAFRDFMEAGKRGITVEQVRLERLREDFAHDRITLDQLEAGIAEALEAP
jgi:hypothetical protein